MPKLTHQTLMGYDTGRRDIDGEPIRIGDTVQLLRLYCYRRETPGGIPIDYDADDVRNERTVHYDPPLRFPYHDGEEVGVVKFKERELSVEVDFGPLESGWTLARPLGWGFFDRGQAVHLKVMHHVGHQDALEVPNGTLV